MTAVKRITTGEHVTCVASVANDTNSKYLMGGSLVEAVGTVDAELNLPNVKAATDASVKVLGVALKDTLVGTISGDATTDTYGFPILDVSVPERTTTVERGGVYPVTYTAAAVLFGVKLCTAANGKVRAWVSGTDTPASIIGECAEPAGVSSSGGVAKALIY